MTTTTTKLEAAPSDASKQLAGESARPPSDTRAHSRRDRGIVFYATAIGGQRLFGVPYPALTWVKNVK